MRLTSKFSRRISGRISAKRRSRLAAPLVLVLGLLVMGGVYNVVSPATAETKTDDASLIAKGKALFLVGCASCHGQNAQGIITDRGTQYGPSLVGVGAAAVQFQVATGRMPMAQPGQQALRKPALYNQDEIEAMSAYVASLAPGPAVPSSDKYDTSDADQASVLRGGEFFRTNCTACHNFAGSGGALPEGKFAPSLIGVSNQDIYLAMLTGPQQMPVFSDHVLKPEDKRDIIAYLKKNEDTPNYGGFALGSFGPVSEGFFAWVLGIGGLVLVAVWIAARSTTVQGGGRFKKKGE